MRAEFLQRFIDGKAWIVSRNFEQHPAWFPEIEGEEVIPVDLRRYVQAEGDNFFTKSHQHFLILNPERHVMDGSAGIQAVYAMWRFDDIYHRRGGGCVRDIAVTIAFLAGCLVLKNIGQHLRGVFHVS